MISVVVFQPNSFLKFSSYMSVIYIYVVASRGTVGIEVKITSTVLRG